MKTSNVHSVPSAEVHLVPASSKDAKKPRIYYMDRLRFALTVLVILHHCMWAVVPTGWYPFVRPWAIDVPTIILGYMFCSGNQAYFMGLFFFLSGLVTAPSLSRKGTGPFLKDRFLRLMVPTILYELVLFPLLLTFVVKAWYDPVSDKDTPINEIWNTYFTTYRGFPQNQMWFAETLFAFNIVAALSFMYIQRWRDFAFSQSPLEQSLSLKEITVGLLKLGFLLFALNYAFRALFCAKEYVWVAVIGNLAFICQYCVAFIFGIVANSYQYLDHMKKEHLKVTIPCVVILYFGFQVMVVPACAPVQTSLNCSYHSLLFSSDI
jgi:glucan biosynthesis protein C